MSIRKSNKTADECHSELSSIGQRSKAAIVLEIEKSKLVTEKMIWISSKVLFPSRVPILIEVAKSTNELERIAIITKRMNRNDNITT